jgi:hypothetical protein
VSSGWGAAVAVVGIALVLWWRDRRSAGTDPELEAAEAEDGARLLLRVAAAVVVLAVALVLQSLDVPGAAIVAIVAFAVLLGLLWIGPSLGPRRRR